MTERETKTSIRRNLTERSERKLAIYGRRWVAASLALVLACAPDLPMRPGSDGLQKDGAATPSAAAPTRKTHNTSQTAGRALASGATTKLSSATASDFVQGLRALRQIPADSIAKWGRSLDEFARLSKWGESSVSLRRMILYAIAAPSDAEVHERIARLPVTITDVPAVNAGVVGHYRNYAVRGKPQISLFFPSPNAGRPRPDDDAASWVEGEGERIVVIAAGTEGALSAAEMPARDVCSTTYNGTVYTGDCATQQELDDAVATIAAMDAEVNSSYDEAVQACRQILPDDPACPEPAGGFDVTVSDAIPVSATRTVLEDGSDGSPVVPTLAMAPALEGCRAVITMENAGYMVPRGSETPGRCAGEAIGATIGLAGWVGAKLGAYSVLVDGASAAGVAGAVIGVITAGFGAGYAIGSWLSCIHAA